MIKKKSQQEEEPRDLGFGTTVTGKVNRLLNKDGNFNVRRIGLPFFFHTSNLYNWLISMPWNRFNLLVFLFYILINTLFAILYYFIGVEHLAGVQWHTETEKFMESFFFSAQTLTTVGYGRISPMGFATSSLAAVESLTGLLGFALVTGLLYGRFSRPVARVMMSENMLIAPYKGITSLQFRLANARSNQLIEAEAQVMLSTIEMENGVPMRRFNGLSLERKNVNLLSLSWTVVHPIDEQSPLYGLTPKDLEERDAEFIILLKAFDDTFSQTVHTRSSYKYHEIIWGAKFELMFHSDSRGYTNLYLNKLNKYTKAELPPLPKAGNAK